MTQGLLYFLEMTYGLMQAAARSHMPMTIMTRAIQITGTAPLLARLVGRVRNLEQQRVQAQKAQNPNRQAKCDHLSDTGQSLWHRYGAGKAGSLAKCTRCDLRMQWQKDEAKWEIFEPKSRASSAALPPPSLGVPVQPATSQPETRTSRSKAPPARPPAATSRASASTTPPPAQEEERTSMWTAPEAVPLNNDDSDWSEVQEMEGMEDDV